MENSYKILIFGRRLDGKNGITGIIEGCYLVEELSIFKENYSKRGEYCYIEKITTIKKGKKLNDKQTR